MHNVVDAEKNNDGDDDDDNDNDMEWWFRIVNGSEGVFYWI